MDQRMNYTPGSTQGAPVLDVKPLRSLSPMFPPTFGFTLRASSGTPFVCVSHFGTSASQSQPGQLSNDDAFTAGLSNPHTQARPSMVASLNEYVGMCDGATTSGQRTTKQKSVGSAAEGSQKKKKPRIRHAKVLDVALSDDPREAVEAVLMTYDALRRRLLQIDEANNANKISYLKAGTIMMDNDLRSNSVKRIGSIPGVDIGDMFFFRFEICLIGLHAPSISGIDFLTTRCGNENDTVAISIVSSGGYENEADDVDVLVYTGQGGGGKVNDRKTQVNDQKLERGNLALERSLHQGNQIRVIRGTKDWSVQNGKIYFYDGLYKVHESWVEKGKSGFNLFKYKLLREPGQPEGYAVWKMTEKWKQNPSARANIISPDISSGQESVPICLVNEVDEEQGPRPFSYATKLCYTKPVNIMSPLHGCTCTGVCLPTDGTCYCSRQNGGDLAYSSFGSLVRRMPLIHECNSSCKCVTNCRNRVTQKGIKLRLEVFRTTNRGWGVRSWDPIRAGMFICEYIGDVINTNRIEQDGQEDNYVFNPNALNKSFRWNYGTELLGEPSVEENPKPLPFVITAKRIGNVSRFMNHSCSPNVFWQAVQHDHGDESSPHIMFFAMKHIPPMVELTYDYGQGGHRSKDCLCGSKNCRGIFG